jgi:hypothetical protein
MVSGLKAALKADAQEKPTRADFSRTEHRRSRSQSRTKPAPKKLLTYLFTKNRKLTTYNKLRKEKMIIVR